VEGLTSALVCADVAYPLGWCWGLEPDSSVEGGAVDELLDVSVQCPDL
jgi:hypothetical protein